MNARETPNLKSNNSAQVDVLDIEAGENSAERLLHFFRQRQRRISDETGG